MSIQSLSLSITGMSCGHCVNAVRNTLDALPGVTVEQVTIGRAVVQYDAAQATADRIVQAVTDEGYEAVATH
jgi:copper chaperone